MIDMSFKQLKYYPELNGITGSINATLVLLQLEYWSEKCKGNQFYKFLDVCEHEKYRQGDSWVEELGFTKHEFRTAFAKIGKVYKSKKAFKESKDLFEGKYYASYYDRVKGLTFYIRNDEAVNKLFQNHTQDDLNLENTQIPVSTNTENVSPISIEYNNKLTSVKDTQTTACVPYETIKALFNNCCTSYPQVTVLTTKRKAMLQKLWHDMGQTLEDFKSTFLQAQSSDFLSGRKGGWRASFDWLLQEEKFIAIQEGVYDNYAHQTLAKGQPPKNKFTDIYSHNWDFEQLEKLEDQYIDNQVSRYQLATAAI
jgi:hypothetical protein